MYLVRRVAKTQPGKAWEVAQCLYQICEAYEQGGRSKAQVYFAASVPGAKDVVCAEWTQESIQPTKRATVPKAVYDWDAKMQPLITSYDLEIYDVITGDRLKERGLL